MQSFILYGLSVLFIALLGILFGWVFWRYRFKGDRTPQIVGVFLIMAIASVILTVYLANQANAQNSSNFQTFI